MNPSLQEIIHIWLKEEFSVKELSAIELSRGLRKEIERFYDFSPTEDTHAD